MTLAAMVAVSGCAVAASSSVRAMPAAVISQASGQFQITNSKDGQAIFQAQGLAPGQSVSGTVQLSNPGTIVGDLGLEQLDVQDQPGAHGGYLSGAVHLDVQDITGGNLIPIYAGQLASLHPSALGKLAPGQAHTYRFTASLPDSGAPASPTSGDNAYEGSALTVRYAWKATAPDPDGGGNELTPTASFRVNAKRLLKRGWLDVLVTCNRACGVAASAKTARLPSARKGIRFRRKAAMLPLAGNVGRIRLKLSKHQTRQLRGALRTRRRVPVRVKLRVVPVGWTTTLQYTKKVAVKRSRTRVQR